MSNTHSPILFTAILGAVMVLGLAAPDARADVKVQTVTHFSGFAGMGASDMHSVEYFQGDKKRSETSLKFTGAVMGSLQKWMTHNDQGSQFITIYRVGENRMFVLEPGKKTYRESPIYTPPQAEKHAESPSSGASDTSKSGQDDAEEVRVVKSELKIQDTGKTQVINSFNTHEYLLTWDLETENVKTNERGRSLLTTELWNSEDARFTAARNEEQLYNRAYAKLFKVAMPTDMAKQFGLERLGYLSSGDLKSFSDKLSQIKGYPVLTNVKWEAGCTANCPKSEQSAPEEPANSGASGDLGGMLGSFFNKKAQQKTQSQPSTSANGLTTIFESRTEVQSIDTNRLALEDFQVPSGYTKN